VIIVATILRLAVSKKSGFVYTTGFLIVKHLKAFFEPILGHNLPLSKTLWFVGGIFIYIFGANLYSLGLDWILAFSPPLWLDYLRPINADINTTLGMAILMIFISHIIMIRYRGFFGYIGHFLFHFHGHSFTEKCISVVVGWLHLVGE
jgi:F0F1-type ATP synthase membrane subunit a